MDKIKKKMGRKAEVGVPRESILLIRLTDAEKDAIKQHFGTSVEVRSYLLKAVQEGKVHGNAGTS